ncbi:MAG: hypothetical protein QOH36_211 [Actinomycetota bacterium]|nr:hypothetical protein [Actinomycetota bacterium]
MLEAAGDEVRIVHRAGGRAGDGARFAAASMRAGVIYAVDLAVAPVAAGVLGSAGPGTTLVVDTGDSPADFLRLVSAGRARVAAARLMERVALGAADLVVVRGPYHAAQLRARGVGNVAVVPDGVDLTVFRPWEDADLRRRLRLDDAFTVGIQGYFTWFPKLGGGMGWELVHAMAARPDLPIRAVLIGDGPGLAEVRLLAHRLGVGDRVHVIGRVPYAELPRYLGLCDVCLLTLTDDPASWVRTTGKLPGYLAAGRYILATRVGTAADLLPDDMLLDYHGPWDRSYPERLAERLAEVVVDPDRRDKGLAVTGLAERFDYDRVAREAADAIRATTTRAATAATTAAGS